MARLKYREWEFIVDRQATKLAYGKASIGSAESCNCNDCKNFAEYRNNAYPDEIKELFINLGIDFYKESNISHFARLESGLHYYGGWFHFKGEFIGKDCLVSLKDGNSIFDLTAITDNFSIGFRVDSALSFFENKEDLVQIEFDAKIPWVINKELESE